MSVTLSAPAPATNSEKNPCQPDPEKLKELEALAGKTHRAYKALQEAQAKLDKAIKEHGAKSPEAHAARKVLKHATREFEKLNEELQKKREEVLHPCGKDPSPDVPKKSEPEPQPQQPTEKKSTQDGKKSDKKPEVQRTAPSERPKEKVHGEYLYRMVEPLSAEEWNKKIAKDKDLQKLLDELQKQPRGEMLIMPYSLFKKRPAVPMPVDPKVPPNPKPDPIPPKAPEPKEPAAPK